MENVLKCEFKISFILVLLTFLIGICEYRKWELLCNFEACNGPVKTSEEQMESQEKILFSKIHKVQFNMQFICLLGKKEIFMKKNNVKREISIFNHIFVQFALVQFTCKENNTRN